MDYRVSRRLLSGLLCVNIFKPGIVNPEIREKMLSHHHAFNEDKLGAAMQQADGGWSNLIEIFHRMVPTNLFKAAVEGQLLGLIFFGLLFGFLFLAYPEKENPLKLNFGKV